MTLQAAPNVDASKRRWQRWALIPALLAVQQATQAAEPQPLRIVALTSQSMPMLRMAEDKPVDGVRCCSRRTRPSS